MIAVTAISVGIGVQTYNIQAADAAAKLPDNSVRSETIVNGQVKAEDIAAGVIPTGDPGQLVVTERSSVS